MKKIGILMTIILLAACASTGPKQQAKYELAFIKALNVYQVEQGKCFEGGDVLNGAYLESCPISTETTLKVDRLIDTYEVASLRYEDLPKQSACRMSIIASELVAILKVQDVPSLAGFCGSGGTRNSEVDAILEGSE